jgi:hypothetical protein
MKYLILLLMIIIRIKEIKSIVLFDTIKNTLGLTLFVSSLIEIYTRIPLKIMYNSTPKLLNLKSKESNIVLIFPGYGGPDKNTNDLLKKISESSKIDESFMHNILAESRVIKNDEEIQIMRWASEITCEAHCNVMKNCKPGMRES